MSIQHPFHSQSMHCLARACTPGLKLWQTSQRLSIAAARTRESKQLQRVDRKPSAALLQSGSRSASTRRKSGYNSLLWSPSVVSRRMVAMLAMATPHNFLLAAASRRCTCGCLGLSFLPPTFHVPDAITASSRACCGADSPRICPTRTTTPESLPPPSTGSRDRPPRAVCLFCNSDSARAAGVCVCESCLSLSLSLPSENKLPIPAYRYTKVPGKRANLKVA